MKEGRLVVDEKGVSRVYNRRRRRRRNDEQVSVRRADLKRTRRFVSFCCTIAKRVPIIPEEATSHLRHRGLDGYCALFLE